MSRYSLLLLLAVSSQQLVAQTGGSIRPLTAVEIQQVAETRAEFHDCVEARAMEKIPATEDVRVIAGTALQACTAVLDILAERLTTDGIHPGMIDGVIRRIRQRTVQQILPLLMILKSRQRKTE